MTLSEMLKNEDYSKIWSKYCGFLDLTIDEVMEIQERLLMEQIELLSKSEIGEKIMGKGVKPKSIKEFREKVPLTSYEDYADILLNKEEDKLPAKTMYWIQTTWRGGSHPIKLAPYSESIVQEHTKCVLASLILSTSEKKGHFTLRELDKFLYGMAPLPYLTGLLPYIVGNEIEFDYLPPLDKAEDMTFEERNINGFKIGMESGIDLFFGLSSVLVRIGESFVKGQEGSKNKNNFKPKTLHMWYKVIKAFIKSKINKTPILPKDIWDLKGILCGGTDTRRFVKQIEYYWGKKPREVYGGTELTVVATETWGDKGLTFFPDVNFLEFIPEKESVKNLNDKSYIPTTVLLNEIKPGERYELVTTKFKGGSFVRYRVGDIIECTATDNFEYGIYIPQVRYVDRISNIIDLAGFTRLTTDTIEKAFELGEIPVQDWVAAKEYVNEEPILHIYYELNQKNIPHHLIKDKISTALKEVDHDYKDIEILLHRDPLVLTSIPQGKFKNVKEEFKIPFSKINPGDEVIKKILS
ncbi:GH3 auxin-responsive promoter [Clostridium amylolyticum]|uniref:GH3 auxin-responsive promoter n=1 Tax=Clostridium amylolyticum TaxID=1121298 RepID=A0A1M6GXZ0_9CLOT|nr:GH3 auxin-responsive promoter family protein [Clostridium amylolyticum]SHJ14794.1 GH3 auxin-responsive promoter [Clostridium amylolyticum]